MTKCSKTYFKTWKLVAGSRWMRSRRASSRSLRSWMLAMFVSSFISSAGITGGSLLEKKSLSAVATAFTGMSSSLIETDGSETWTAEETSERTEKEEDMNDSWEITSCQIADSLVYVQKIAKQQVSKKKRHGRGKININNGFRSKKSRREGEEERESHPRQTSGRGGRREPDSRARGTVPPSQVLPPE